MCSDTRVLSSTVTRHNQLFSAKTLRMQNCYDQVVDQIRFAFEILSI